MNYWRVFCKEEEWPGLWQHWLDGECVTVGWPPPDFEYRFDDAGKGDRRWSTTRRYLGEMEPGDQIVVHLEGNRVGRIGEVVRKSVADKEWDPLVPRSRVDPEGEQGRRIFVRWDERHNSQIPWWVSKLPEGKGFLRGPARQAISRLNAKEFKRVQSEISDLSNFVPIPEYESPSKRYLAEFVAANPGILGEGLKRYPSRRMVARVFKESSRANALLVEKNGTPIVVECIGQTPELEDIRRVRRCMEIAKRETSIKPRGILIHVGLARMDRKVLREANRTPEVELRFCSMSLDMRYVEGTKADAPRDVAVVSS